MGKKIREIKGLVGSATAVTIEYSQWSPIIIFRMARRYLYFEESRLVAIKNHLAASIRELKILRDDWYDNKTASKKQVRIHTTSNLTACMEPSRCISSCVTRQEVSYFVSLRSVDANTLLRDIKDVLLKIRLSKKKKKKFGHSDKK